MSEVLIAPPPAPRQLRSRAATREVWLERLARFPASGLTVAQFCAIEVVSVPSFYFWKRRLAAEVRSLDGTAAKEFSLLPIRLPSSVPPVELVLSTGTVLRLLPGCDLDWVRSLVAALGGASC
jgi:transposase